MQWAEGAGVSDDQALFVQLARRAPHLAAADRARPARRVRAAARVRAATNMERLQRIFSSVGGGGAAAGPQGDTPQVDTSEQVYISSLALLKMLKHGARLRAAACLRAGSAFRGGALNAPGCRVARVRARRQAARACRWR